VRKRSEEFARGFVDKQRGQFQRLGVLGEWEHPYLTLDPAYEAEILRSFATFVEQGKNSRSCKNPRGPSSTSRSEIPRHDLIG